jgi:beta-xylosidase
MKVKSEKLKVKSFCGVIVMITLFFSVSYSQYVSKVWVADNGDGTYKNPIIHADYSDPDAIGIGDDFYMTASSFTDVPALPVLHSKDLVNWKIINHVFRQQEPLEVFAKPQHGGGVWAPSIRFHAGEFFIFWGDPDFGIYMTKTKNPSADWSKPLLIKEAKGWIDSCPFWDDDGKAYLVHAFAGSRSGIKSILAINKMSPDGTKLLDDGVIVFDGHDAHPVIEGPKIYKRNGFYYIFAPAGGVTPGWQLALKSKNIYGKYEEKIVLARGNTSINGPHQGAWVTTQTGEDWFLHFQDKGAYGRIVHLQPMKWVNDFPVIGNNGEPVLSYRKPNVGKTYPIFTPQESDEFNDANLGLQWQWHANFQPIWAMPFPSRGVLRMNSVQIPEGYKSLWDVPNLLLQKFSAERFTATVKVTLEPRFEGERFGLTVMGMDYSAISAMFKNNKLFVSQEIVKDADKGTKETEGEAKELSSKTFYFRVNVQKEAVCTFSYSIDGNTFSKIGVPFKAREGKWIGAKVGLFYTHDGKFNDHGTADVDWFRIE